MTLFERLWGGWVAILAGGALLFIAGQLFPITAWFKNDTNAAAWVQAIGSILAIIATVGVVQIQHRNERRLERDRQRRADADRLEAPLSVLRMALEAVQRPAGELWCKTAAETYFINEWSRSRFNHIEQVLGSYPFATIPSGLLQVEFLTASRAFVASYSLVSQVSDTQGKADFVFSSATATLKHHASAIGDAVRAFEAHKQEALSAP